MFAISAISFFAVIAGVLVAAAMVAAPYADSAFGPTDQSGWPSGHLRTRSVKCEIGMIPNISKKRLADCESAKLIQRADEDFADGVVLFQINPEDKKISNGNRAELRDMYEAVNGEEIWYRISTKLPSDFPIGKQHRLVLSQWHERTRDGERSLRPPLSHRLWNGRFVVTLWNQDRIDRQGIDGDGEILFEMPEMELGVYYDFIYKTVWSPDSNGRIVGWMRKCSTGGETCEDNSWQEIIRNHGPNGYRGVLGYYFKYGLYTVSEFDTAFMAYHRDYQAGDSARAIGATDPVFLR